MAKDTVNLYQHFVPSLGAAIAFTVIFTILTIAHTVLIIGTQRKFPIIIVIGGLFEIVGHAFRTYSRFHLNEQAPFSVQITLIFLAPILFAGGIYMFLGRLIRASGYPHLSPIRTNWVTKIFLLGDIFCFLVQLVGVAKLIKPKTPDDIKSGQDIVLGGLGLQIIIFGFFVIVSIIFHARFQKRTKMSDQGLVEQQLWTLYICSVLILVRSIYRFVEYKDGNNGYLMSHEWPAYVFDTFLMATVMVISLNWYRGSLKPMDPTRLGHDEYPLRG